MDKVVYRGTEYATMSLDEAIKKYNAGQARGELVCIIDAEPYGGKQDQYLVAPVLVRR